MDEAAIIPILYNMWRALPGLELGNSRTRKTLGLYDREIGWVGNVMRVEAAKSPFASTCYPVPSYPASNPSINLPTKHQYD